MAPLTPASSDTSQYQIRDDEGRFAVAKMYLEEADPYFRMMDEELDAFFARVQKRYEEYEGLRDPYSQDNSRILFSMRRALSVKFGVDAAKRILPAPRSTTRWNAFQRDHWDAKFNELKERDGSVRPLSSF